MEHSSIMGGSNAGQRIHCPGSYALEKDLPRSSSSYADRGTALHSAAEDYLLNHMDADPPSVLLGRTYDGVEITPELLRDKLIPSFDALDDVVRMAGGSMELLVEVCASLDSVVPDAFGTTDVVGMGADGKLYVIDFKFGDGVLVNVEANYQLAFYTSCLLHDDSLPELRAVVDPVALRAKPEPNVVFAVIQCRPTYPDEPNLQTWATSTRWVDEFLQLAIKARAQMEIKNPPLKIGAHCRWCKAKPGCPAQQEQAQGLLAAAVKPSLLDTVSLATWLDRVESIKEFVSAMEEYAHDEMDRGVTIPGWKIVPKRATRKYIVSPAKVAAKLTRHLKAAVLWKKTLITPAQAESALGKKKYERILKPLVEYVSSGTTIARTSDGRQDVGSANSARTAKLKAAKERSDKAANEQKTKG